MEEVARMKNQAQLGHLLRKETVRRCKRHSRTTDGHCGTECGPPMTTSIDWYQNWPLQKHEERWVTRLTGVTTVPCVGETGLGTLEAHVNGFTYSVDRGWDEVIIIMHDNVKWCIYGLGNEMQPPLMQFHLENPIKIRNTEAKDIQFHLVPTRFSSSRNEDLKKFVQKVPETQFACKSELPFTPVTFLALDEFQFDAALPTGAPTICSLTRYCLVVLLKQPPYFVVTLWEIKIVNLVCLGDGIEMTVVFEDLERDVLQLRSIPLKLLTDIKDRLNRNDVKYYVNNLRPNWSDVVSVIRESPEVFLAEGGWDIFEDSLTLANYPSANSYPDLDSEGEGEEIVYY